MKEGGWRMGEESQERPKGFEPRHDISVILFEGDSSAFSAGVDIKAHLPEQIHEMLTSFHPVIRAIVASCKVTISAVPGACLGAGADFPPVCHILYHSPATPSHLPEIKLP